MLTEKKTKESKADTEHQQQCPVLGENRVIPVSLESKTNKEQQKEGLGPSEVALRATSHDPQALPPQKTDQKHKLGFKTRTTRRSKARTRQKKRQREKGKRRKKDRRRPKNNNLKRDWQRPKEREKMKEEKWRNEEKEYE